MASINCFPLVFPDLIPQLLTRRARNVLGTATQCMRMNDSPPQPHRELWVELAHFLDALGADEDQLGRRDSSHRPLPDFRFRRVLQHRHLPEESAVCVWVRWVKKALGEKGVG
jgi:hypothetical protein